MQHSKQRFSSLIIALVAIMAMSSVNVAWAKGGSSGGFGGGSKGSFSSGGSKPSSGGGSKVSSGGSKPSGSGGTKVTSGGSKPKPTPAKPSTGSKPQPVPVTKLVPAVAPAKVTGPTGKPKFQPSGRDYYRDRQTVLRNPAYADPYGGRSYYGAFDSPFFYLWLFSVMDGDDGNNPLPPQSDEKIDESILSYLQAVQAMQSMSVDKS